MENFYNISLRNIVSLYFKQFMPMITLPGPVEIDECHIGARVRGKFGRPPAPGKIVFGIKCRTTGIVLLFPVQNKSKEVLLPILVQHVEEGSQVFSDKYSSYVTRFGRSHIEEEGFDHYFINHFLHFVDPVQSFIHTNNIERTWRSLKASISHVKRSLSNENIDSFLNTFQFQTFFSQENLYDVFLQILVSIFKNE